MSTAAGFMSPAAWPASRRVKPQRLRNPTGTTRDHIAQALDARRLNAVCEPLLQFRPIGRGLPHRLTVRASPQAYSIPRYSEFDPEYLSANDRNCKFVIFMFFCLFDISCENVYSVCHFHVQWRHMEAYSGIWKHINAYG